MNSGIYQMISVAAFSMTAILFVAAVFLFIKFNIAGLINDLSGQTANKQIQEIRRKNEQDNIKKNKNSPSAYELNFNNPYTDKSTVHLYQNQEETELLNQGINTEMAIQEDKADSILLIKNGMEGGLAHNIASVDQLLYAITEELTDYDKTISSIEFNVVRSIVIVHSDITVL